MTRFVTTTNRAGGYRHESTLGGKRLEGLPDNRKWHWSDLALIAFMVAITAGVFAYTYWSNLP